MKLIVAVIPPDRLEPVKDALAETEVFRMTVGDVQALAPRESWTAAAPAGPDSHELVPKVKLEVAVNETFVEPALAAIARGARDPGTPEPGHIFVLPLTEAIRIRTAERGPEAI